MIVLTPAETAALDVAARSGKRDIPAPSDTKAALRALAARAVSQIARPGS